MESKRQQKVSKLLQKDLSDIFLKEGKDILAGSFVTVTNVMISPDLSYAKVYLSFFDTNTRQETLDRINEHAKAIRGALGAKVRMQLRIVPHLAFYIDDTADHVERIEKLFANLHIPPADA